MTRSVPSRQQIADWYLDQLQWDLYPFQEEALLAWFSADQGVLVSAPTGMGKTLIAEAALFEALHTGTVAYYTTPLIALTEQKFREMQQAAVRWGFEPTDVGLVTGNRRENPDARVLVVVAEILFNRLLHREVFDFADVSAVVMDEFHSFNDPERGIVWEFSLGLLPEHVRLLLLSATVGNAAEFLHWLRTTHRHTLQWVHSEERRVPLVYQWVPNKLLVEQVEEMADGDESSRKTPALVFCFNREECWAVAEQLKGRRLIASDQQKALAHRLKQCDLSQGAGPKLRQLLLRGVGVHHAGVLPKYRRLVEDLFQRKLLSVCVCTETLAAGINLPARSVVVPRLMKGPQGKKKLLSPSAAHQMFGRAGRPQYDTQGYVFVLAHEDDVRIARWREQFDRIPEGTKDPALLKAKKQLKRKQPKRRTNEQYWTETQFDKLRKASPEKLRSRGPIPWRLLAHMLDASPEVDPIRRLINKRLMDSGRLEACRRWLDKMLLTLWCAGYVTLEPPPPTGENEQAPTAETDQQQSSGGSSPFRVLLDQQEADRADHSRQDGSPKGDSSPGDQPPLYQPQLAHPTETLSKLLLFRSVNPLYGVFLINQLGAADRQERIQAIESVLEFPRSVGYALRVPSQRELPPGPLATTRLDVQLLRLGLVTPEQLSPAEEDPEARRSSFDEPPVRVLTLAEKLKLLFEYDYPNVHDVRIEPVWAAGALLEHGGRFNKLITSHSLQKQEGIVFRHLLRMILLLREFAQLCPPDTTPEEWEGDLLDVAAQVTESCRQVDPSSTERALQEASAASDLGDAT